MLTGFTAYVFAVYGCKIDMFESSNAGCSSGAPVSISLKQPSQTDCTFM